MMQPAEVRDLNNRAARRRLRRPRDGRILVERQVGSPPVVVDEVVLEVATQRALVPHDDVVEALVADGADHPFDEWILPESPRCRQDLAKAHRAGGPAHFRAVDGVAITEEEAWRGVPGEGLGAGGPSRRRSDAP